MLAGRSRLGSGPPPDLPQRTKRGQTEHDRSEDCRNQPRQGQSPVGGELLVKLLQGADKSLDSESANEICST